MKIRRFGQAVLVLAGEGGVAFLVGRPIAAATAWPPGVGRRAANDGSAPWQLLDASSDRSHGRA